MRFPRIKLKTWLKFTSAIFLLLLLIYLALPALLLVLRVPSFVVGDRGWLLRWQNDATGSGIQFNLIFLFVIAVVLGLIVTLFKSRR